MIFARSIVSNQDKFMTANGGNGTGGGSGAQGGGGGSGGYGAQLDLVGASMEDPAAAAAAETAAMVEAVETAAPRAAGERCGWQLPTSMFRETEYLQ